MGRPRKHNTDLPARLIHRHGGYYYVTGGEWLHFGSDKATASERAAALNSLSRREKTAVLGSLRTASKKLREDVFARDEHRCIYCSATRDLVLDHFIPYEAGGATHQLNLVTACAACNDLKGRRDPRDFLATLAGLRLAVLDAAIARLSELSTAGDLE